MFSVLNPSVISAVCQVVRTHIKCGYLSVSALTRQIYILSVRMATVSTYHAENNIKH